MLNQKENLNFYHIQTLLKECNRILYILLEKTHNSVFGTLDNKAKDKLVKLKVLQKHQEIVLLTKPIKEWDISLTSRLLSHPSLSIPDDILNNIKKIRDIRNEISHKVDCAIDDDKYQEMLANLIKALKLINLNSDKEIDELKQFTLSVDIKQEKPSKFDELKLKANDYFKLKKYKEAIEYYTQAIELDNVSNNDRGIAYSNRSNCYFNIYSSNLDDENLLTAAKNDIKIAISLNPTYMKAYYRLGKIYEAEEKYEKALSYYKKALYLDNSVEDVKNCISLIKSKLGIKNRYEHLYSENFPKTLEDEIDNIKTDFKMRMGFDTPDDFIRSSEKMLFDQDPSIADVFKGHEYRDGSNNVKQDFMMAAKYYSKAASKGNAEGLFNIAKLTCLGKGCQVDYGLAMNFYLKAANMTPKVKILGQEVERVGVRQAQHSLGLMFQEGICGKIDLEKSLFWYKKAVENGSHPSANNIGLMYFDGNELIKRDLDLAEYYFTFAHTNGNQQAAGNLVTLNLVRRNPEKALTWHEIANKEFGYLSTFSEKNEEIIKHLLLISGKNKENIYSEQKSLNVSENNLNQEKILEKIKLDPKRKICIVNNRNSINTIKNTDYNNKNIVAYTAPSKTNKSKTIISNKLTEVTLSTINLTKDEILYDNFMILTIIDVPRVWIQSTMFIVEDTNKFVERMSVYNIGSNFKEIYTNYPIGTCFKLINPYIRMAMDGQVMIRVDDPDTIVIERIKNRICRFCQKEDSKYKCSKCGALYCSKACQMLDFESFSHNLVCMSFD